MMAAMAVTVRLYRTSFSRRRLFLFYGLTCAGGAALRLCWLFFALPVFVFSAASMILLAWGTLKITGERIGRVVTVFCLLFTGAAFCEVLAGILFYRGPALAIPEVWESEQMVAAALVGNGIWVAYLAAAAALWLQLERRCSASYGKQLSFLIIVEAVCLIFQVIPVYCQCMEWNMAVGAGILLQILGTLGFARLQLRYEEVKAMEEKVRRLELKSQEEYERYVELEQKYRQLHQIRHDFNNQLTTAYYLMQAGKKERALQLLDEMAAMLEGDDGRDEDGGC